MREVDPLAWRLPRDRLIVAACLGLIVAAAWAWTLQATLEPPEQTGSGDPMSSMIMSSPSSMSYFMGAFAMWVPMMIAMMLPSASPMILLYARVARSAKEQGAPLAPTALFAGVYLAVWAGFALLAALAQTALHQANMLSAATLRIDDQRLAGGLLIAAGLYQVTPLKNACLATCRSPLTFLTRLWRPGWKGAIRLGLAHGAYCVGCCWLLMTLLFAGGIMSLTWIAALAIFVLLEKLVPTGPRPGLILGTTAILTGFAIAAGFVSIG